MHPYFLLIDCENLPAKSEELKPLREFENASLLVFTGTTQKNVAWALLDVLQPFGKRYQRIPAAGSGKNALDFHIAYHLGRLAHEHPNARLRILSKDKGFDSLIKHLKETDIDGGRCETVAVVLAELRQDHADRVAKPTEQMTPPAKLVSPKKASAADLASEYIKLLCKRELVARPHKLKALQSDIANFCRDRCPEDLLSGVLHILLKTKKVVVKDNKVTYGLD